MTRLAQRFSLAVVAVLVAVTGVGAQGLRTPSYRPYITEVGPPHTINRKQLDKETQVNSDLESWIHDYGYPDVAEIQEVVPEYGWSDYEVRIYYLARNQELAFGRIAFFPRQGDPAFVSNYGLVKFQGSVQPENRKRVQYAARISPCVGGDSLDRILAAAERAERAALVAEKESMRAADAAARAETAVNNMESGFAKSLRK